MAASDNYVFWKKSLSENLSFHSKQFFSGNSVAGALQYAERECLCQIGSLQILKSAKGAALLKEWMAESILRNNYSTYCWKNYSKNGWLQVLVWK